MLICMHLFICLLTLYRLQIIMVGLRGIYDIINQIIFFFLVGGWEGVNISIPSPHKQDQNTPLI